MEARLKAAMHNDPPRSPVMSVDFLVNYLAFGPLRQKVGKTNEALLPAVMDVGEVRYLVPELLTEADQLHQELSDLEPRVVKRRIRDHLDKARRRIGRVAQAGLNDLPDDEREA